MAKNLALATITLPGGSESISIGDRFGYGGLTVEDFGAVGDDVTDDTAAIQAALDSGARHIWARGIYRVTDTLELASEQFLHGNPLAMIEETDWSATRPSNIHFQTDAGGKPAIKNASGTRGNGVMDLIVDMDPDNANAYEHTVIQFAATYGNVAKNIWLKGRFNLGILAHDTYVCNFEDIVGNALLVRQGIVWITGSSETVKVSRAHISSMTPADAAVPLYGIVVAGGSDHLVDQCIMQGCTIGLASVTVHGLVINAPYFENTIMPFRFGTPGSGPQGDMVVNGGSLRACGNGSHVQFADRGPLALLNCAALTWNGLSGISVADNTQARGPFPIVIQNVGQVVFNGPRAETGSVRDLFLKSTGSPTGGYQINGVPYGSNSGTEMLLRADSATSMLGGAVRIDGGGALATNAFTPATIHTAVDSLLNTALPSGAGLVL